MALMTFCSVWFVSMPPAQALLRQIEEQPGQMLYQSRQSLRDDQGDTWQVVLFKRVKDDQQEINLRLVGFPDLVSFKHPAPLMISSAQQASLFLPDLLVENSPGENVGQYLVLPAFSELPVAGIWELTLPLTGGLRLIKVPYFVQQEWQTLLTAPESLEAEGDIALAPNF